MRRGSILKIAAVGVVGLAAAGVFGYRAVTGECIFGMCDSKTTANATVTPVAATGESEPCPMGCSENKATVETAAHEHADGHHHEHADASECSGKTADCASDECDPATCEKPECCAKLAEGATEATPVAPETAPVGG